MLKKSFFKKAICASLVVLQCLILVPPAQTLASTDLPTKRKTSIELFNYEDHEDLKAKIIKDPYFIKNWANMAHCLGFGWCLGTASKEIGEDFEFKRAEEEGKTVYYLSARYNQNDPYAEGYRPHDRLVMKISNARFVIDHDSLTLGKAKVISLDPLASSTLQVVNKSNSEAKTSLSFGYETTESTSKTDHVKFGEKIGIKSSFNVRIPFIGEKSIETNLEFNSEQGWSNTKTNSVTTKHTISHTTTTPAKSRKKVRLNVLNKKSDIPYEGKIYMEYDIEFFGFLRYTGNARKDHPTDRPSVSVKFGGKNNMSAVDHIIDLYKHKDINGYSEWDWNWVEENFYDRFSEYSSNVASQYFGGIISGVFTNVGGTDVKVEEGRERALKNTSSTEQNVEVQNFKSSKSKEFRVGSLTYTTPNGEQTIYPEDVSSLNANNNEN
ncbi:aerolysin family beta-barrel pore-forming toxin [Hathewaya histolytica]|uniref:Alpha-toxin n=1 Tax=Hathewaya histolytica TaxID=1498 RepID=A0A4U9RVD8_HATHI|nr:aerolysin family beta-barrel pore-forming toxin [Hathewaya histolytica]VTQ96395.1 alpha-toxin [Hathewaya histolytica]